MERALLVTVDFKEKSGWSAQERSSELRELTRSAGAKVVREMIVNRHGPSPALFIGKGKAEEIAKLCEEERINIVIFNNDLTGTQQKNLEELIVAKTVDRTQLILDIFAHRARSNEGKFQVELAQLLYMVPRLVGKGIDLSRTGGGIGTVGPGEQKLEVDRRRIRDRISRLEKELEELSARRAMARKQRGRFAALTVAIVGYTNVGKSTLMNSLTDARLLTQDKLFATLDPTTRGYLLPNNQKILFIDTVGFLNELPHHLIEAFKATLEEAAEADLVMHVIDVSHPKAKERSDAVYRVLEEIGVHGKPILTVLNKIDLVPEKGEVERAKAGFEASVAVSAIKKEGLKELIDCITPYISRFMVKVRVRLPIRDAKTVNLLHENGLVTRTEYDGDTVLIEAEIPRRIKEALGL